MFRSKGWQAPARSWKPWLYPWLALLLSLVILAASNYLFVNFLGKSDLGGAVSMLVLVIPGMLVVYTAKPKVLPQVQIDPVVLAVPLTFHALFTIFGFAKGIYTQIPILAVVGLLMFVLGVAIHLYPWYIGRSATD